MTSGNELGHEEAEGSDSRQVGKAFNVMLAILVQILIYLEAMQPLNKSVGIGLRECQEKTI